MIRLALRLFTRPVPALVAAVIAIASIGSPFLPAPGTDGSSAGTVVDHHNTATAASVSTDASGDGSWGYATERLPAYEREIGTDPSQQAVAHVVPRGFGGLYAYCKTPLPNTSRFQYRAAVPARTNAFNPPYRLAWIPGGAITFEKLTSIPRC